MRLREITINELYENSGIIMRLLKERPILLTYQGDNEVGVLLSTSTYSQYSEISGMRNISFAQLLNINPEIIKQRIQKEGILISREYEYQKPAVILISLRHFNSLVAFARTAKRKPDLLLKYLKHGEAIDEGDYSLFQETSNGCFIE